MNSTVTSSAWQPWSAPTCQNLKTDYWDTHQGAGTLTYTTVDILHLSYVFSMKNSPCTVAKNTRKCAVWGGMTNNNGNPALFATKWICHALNRSQDFKLFERLIIFLIGSMFFYDHFRRHAKIFPPKLKNYMLFPQFPLFMRNLDLNHVLVRSSWYRLGRVFLNWK